LAILNRDPTPLDSLADCVIAANIEDILPRLLDLLETAEI
jgi:NAD-dependent SIR2 family protein deacetylase